MPTASDLGLPTGTVTFLFTDIEGSTQLVAALGARYGPVLNAHAEVIRTAIASHDGTEVSTEGDAFFAVFPSAIEAVAAAADAQRRLATRSWPDGVSVRVRMGLHTGEGRPGGDNYIGMDVHRAARIAAAGHGGQVLVSDATRALVAPALPDGLSLRDLAEHRLKDLPAPERIWQLSIEGLPVDFPALRSLDARRGNLAPASTPLIGRDGRGGRDRGSRPAAATAHADRSGRHRQDAPRTCGRRAARDGLRRRRLLRGARRCPRPAGRRRGDRRRHRRS